MFEITANRLFFTTKGSKRICVPKSLQLKIMKAAHDEKCGGHMGITKTQTCLQESHFWPLMLKDIKNYVKTCRSCQSSKTNLHPSVVSTANHATNFEMAYSVNGFSCTPAQQRHHEQRPYKPYAPYKPWVSSRVPMKFGRILVMASATVTLVPCPVHVLLFAMSACQRNTVVRCARIRTVWFLESRVNFVPLVVGFRRSGFVTVLLGLTEFCLGLDKAVGVIELEFGVGYWIS